MEQKRSYSILAAGLAGLNSLVILVIVFLYVVNPQLLQGLIQVELIAGLAVIDLLYYLSLHRYFTKFHQGASTLIMAAITTTNLILVIVQTGGLDSPFYSLWLLAIVVAGLFGPICVGVIVGLTFLVHLIGYAQHNFSSSYFVGHIIQLAISLGAGAIAQWIYYRGIASHKQVVDNLSGRLGEEQIKAQALMSSMADGVIVVDQNRHVQLINRAAQDMTGWDEVSAKNIDYRLILNLKNSTDQTITDQTDPFLESWSKATSIVHNDLVCHTRADKSFALSISISPIFNSSHQITGGIAVFRDISKEKEIERTRNEFVSTASHEMRTPVAAIEGYISLAMNAKVATIDDRAMNYLQKAHDNTQHLGALFRDLLSVTKLDEGLIARNLTPVNLTQMLQDITNDMQFAASKKNLTITFVSQATHGIKTIMPVYWVMVDAERMREVIMNLIENGMKFTQEGGITLGISGDDKTVTVSVHDTGLGIPKEDQGHLFQKFYRVDNSATRTIGGTGLGLYLCRTLIELFNGRIWVDSDFGKGSTFSFSLPRIAEPATQPQPVNASTAPVPVAQPASLPSLTPIPLGATNQAPAPSPAPAPIAATIPAEPIKIPVTTTPTTPQVAVAP